MLYILITSFLWAFSFGLVKGQLVGIDPTAVAVMRMGLALLVFIPFLRVRGLGRRTILKLGGIGALQFGLMYVLYLSSFRYLQAYEVALFTVLTPLYIVLVDALLERTWHLRFLVAAVLAAVGATLVLDGETMSMGRWHGFWLIQGANLCFAMGQLAWRRTQKTIEGLASDAQVFALPYLGAFLVAGLWSLFTTDWLAVHMTGMQILSLIYLGTIASGLCFFWFNLGAERVNAGTLAVLNNAKMPIAVALSILVFDEKAQLLRLIVGGGIIAAGVWIAERRSLWEKSEAANKT